MSYHRLRPQVSQPFSHSHGEDEEIYVVISGGGRVLLGEEIRELGPWDALRVAPEVVRSFAAGPDGLEFLAFGTHTENDAAQHPIEWPPAG